jgi:hypothetical protein
MSFLSFLSFMDYQVRAAHGRVAGELAHDLRGKSAWAGDIDAHRHTDTRTTHTYFFLGLDVVAPPHLHNGRCVRLSRAARAGRREGGSSLCR